MRDKLPDIAAAIKGADKRFLLLGFSVYLCSVIIVSFRLSKVLSVQAIDLTLKEASYLSFIGLFFNNFLPTSFGGDAVKAYYAGKKSNKKAAAFAAIFMDRFLAVIPFTLLPALALTLFNHNINNKILLIFSYALFFISLSLFWLLMSKSAARRLSFLLKPFQGKAWSEKVKRGYGFLNLYSRHKRILLWSFALSVTVQVMSVVSTYFFTRAVGVDDVGIKIFFIFVPIIWILTLTPSLNGLGVREGGFVYFLKDYMPVEKAFAVSILVLASLAVFSIIGGIIYSLKKSQFTVKTDALQQKEEGI
ncbi:MAG: lysylphosphatidylglycerol synthase transmembrane domain-containing protein [Candidatus Omnitrophota bacterium]